MKTLLFAFFLLACASHLQAEQPEYLRHFDPAKGFKPAQANLSEIALQLAGSLECYGSPEPYLRHMQKEHERVSKLFTQKMGKAHASRLPSHLTDAYIDRFARNWNTLSEPLGLNAFAKEIGRCMREGINGTRLTGTLAVQIFNEHQKLVAEKMRGESTQPAGFDELKARLQQELEYGKDNIDTSGYETTRRDAVTYAYVIDDKFRTLFKMIDAAAATEEKAEQMKNALAQWFLDLGSMAHSELEIGILDSGLSQF